MVGAHIHQALRWWLPLLVLSLPLGAFATAHPCLPIIYQALSVEAGPGLAIADWRCLCYVAWPGDMESSPSVAFWIGPGSMLLPVFCGRSCVFANCLMNSVTGPILSQVPCHFICSVEG